MSMPHNLPRQLPEFKETSPIRGDEPPEHVWKHDPSLAPRRTAEITAVEGNAPDEHDSKKKLAVEWVHASQLARRGTEQLMILGVKLDAKARHTIVQAMREAPGRLRDAGERRAARVNAGLESGESASLIDAPRHGVERS